MSKQPPPAPTASTVGPCHTIIKIVGRPGTGSLPRTIAPPDHPRRYQKAVKKAKEDWIGAQCEEIENCLNKNNSKRAYQLVKDLTSEKQGRSSTIQDKSGKGLTVEKEILSRWTEYCSELYNYESCGDNAVLDCSQPPEEDLQPILRGEVEIAVASLKKGKSAGADNIPAELVQAGGETMLDVLTEICNRIWRTGEWPTPWTQSLIITLPKKGQLAALPELQKYQPHQSFKQTHAESYIE